MLDPSFRGRFWAVGLGFACAISLACSNPRREPLPGGDGGSRGADGGPDGYVCLPDSPCALTDNPCLIGASVCAAGEVSCKATDRKQANGTFCAPGSVCLDGLCAGCNRGASCALEGKPCRVGAIECLSGKAECVETGNAANGTTCGSGMVCQAGACSACTSGASCVPPNPCHEGVLACVAGAVQCTDSGRPLPAGASCGPDKVCSASGECVACVSGAGCDTGDPCKIGKLDCSSGAAVCTSSENAPPGKACGNGRVCNDGSCVSCNAGSPCTPENKCHRGALTCADGTPRCMDAGSNQPNGTGCGTDMVCGNGSCVACRAGVTCTTADPCKVGSTSCESGASECQVTGNAANGKTCGTGRVCSNGACVTCVANMACEPSACKVGQTSCTTGMSSCTETGNAPNGRDCGTGRVCNNGSCVSCNEGAACSPVAGNSCRSGTISCASGSAQCRETSQASDGTGCGPNRVCRSASCVACGDNGQPCCAASSCNTGNVCSGSTCVPACTPGAPGSCNTNNNPCRLGQRVCPSGCANSTQPANEGQNCDNNDDDICRNGWCVARDTSRPCGQVGQSCCAGGLCTGDHKVCFSVGGTTGCGNCGMLSFICCDSAPRCDPGLTCRETYPGTPGAENTSCSN